MLIGHWLVRNGNRMVNGSVGILFRGNGMEWKHQLILVCIALRPLETA